MTHGALGLIEVIGLTAALEAADTCLKSSNVQLIGYEKVTSGLVTVKIQGDVGAVKAAISAAEMNVRKVGTVLSTLVIPRPAEGIVSFINSPNAFTTSNEEMFTEVDMAPIIEQVVIEEQGELTVDKGEQSVQEFTTLYPQEAIEKTKKMQQLGNNKHTNLEFIETEELKVEQQSEGPFEKEIRCNLCHDPNCMREKGQPRNQCIHYKSN